MVLPFGNIGLFRFNFVNLWSAKELDSLILRSAWEKSTKRNVKSYVFVYDLLGTTIVIILINATCSQTVSKNYLANISHIILVSNGITISSKV